MEFPLLGSFSSSVDIQRRFSMPRSWRRGEGDIFYLSPFRDGMIQILIPEQFNLLIKNVEHYNFSSNKVFLAQVASSFQKGNLDSQGKFALGPELKEYAKIQNEVFIMGAFFCGLLVAKEKENLLLIKSLNRESLLSAFFDNDKESIEALLSSDIKRKNEGKKDA